MRCSVEVSFYLGSILGSMIFSMYGHGQPIGNSLFPPCLSLYKWTMRYSLSFYPSSESLVHDKFSIFNVSNLYNFLAKRYVGSIDIMRWKKKYEKLYLILLQLKRTILFNKLQQSGRIQIKKNASSLFQPPNNHSAQPVGRSWDMFWITTVVAVFMNFAVLAAPFSLFLFVFY